MDVTFAEFCAEQSPKPRPIELHDFNIDRAIRYLTALGGRDMKDWLPVSDGHAHPRLDVCTLSSRARQSWEKDIQSPEESPLLAELACDEEYDGGHYLSLTYPPLVVVARPPASEAYVTGFFMGNMLWLEEYHRGAGLGKEMIVAAALERGGLPYGPGQLLSHGSNHSHAGIAAMKSAYRELTGLEPDPTEMSQSYTSR